MAENRKKPARSLLAEGYCKLCLLTKVSNMEKKKIYRMQKIAGSLINFPLAAKINRGAFIRLFSCSGLTMAAP